MSGHRFSASEQASVAAVAGRLHRLHRLAAQSKRILEFFHVSKSGGTSFCQLGRLNGCQTESFSTKQNCLMRDFQDYPRWTVPGAIPGLVAERQDGTEPWWVLRGGAGGAAVGSWDGAGSVGGWWG